MFPVKGGPELLRSVPDNRHVQQVIDLCIRVGEVLLASGEGSGETTAFARGPGTAGRAPLVWPGNHGRRRGERRCR